MNVFIASAVLLTLLVVAWLAFALLRKAPGNGVSSEKLNAAIHRDQLHALEQDVARGAISQADFETTRDELQLRLLDDTESFESNRQVSTAQLWTPKRMSLAIAVSVPLLAAGLYLQLGTPAAIDPMAQTRANEQQIKDMLGKLEDKLKANPNDPKGWVMLARSYKVLGRFDDARQAYAKAGEMVKTDPDLLVDYAELLGMQANNKLAGVPAQLIQDALRLNPEHGMALMMAGVAAYQAGDFKTAVVHWEKLQSQIPPDSADAEQMQANIDEARSQGGLTAPASNKLPPIPAGAAAGMTPEKINQMVDRLAAKLKDNPQDLPGWARLARAYKVQNRLNEAIAAYEKTGKLLESDADLLTQYADTLAARDGSLKGKPEQLVQQALRIAPKHPMALMMAGQAAYQTGQFGQAIGYWETALTVLPAQSQDAQAIQAEIADAKRQANAKK